MKFLIALLVATASPAHAVSWVTVVENDTLAVSMDIDSYEERREHRQANLQFFEKSSGRASYAKARVATKACKAGYGRVDLNREGKALTPWTFSLRDPKTTADHVAGLLCD